MLDSFLKFLGLETKEKNPAPKNWTWQKPKEKESTRIFLKIKNAIYKQTEEIIMDYPSINQSSAYSFTEEDIKAIDRIAEDNPIIQEKSFTSCI